MGIPGKGWTRGQARSRPRGSWERRAKEANGVDHGYGHVHEHENEHVHDDVLDDAHENDYMDTLPQARS